MVVSEIAERAGVPFITPTDREPTITAQGVTWTFRTAPTLDAYAHGAGRAPEAAPRRLALLSDRCIVGLSATEGAYHIGANHVLSPAPDEQGARRD